MAQAIFREILAGDSDAVRARVEAKPAVLELQCTGAPTKHRGQSPLQVAINTGQFALAEWLVGAGANIEFSDTTSDGLFKNSVLHDAAKAAVKQARGLEHPGHTLDKTRRDDAYDFLSLLLEAGADVNVLDAHDHLVLTRIAATVGAMFPGRPQPEIPDVTAQDLHRVFEKLYEYGADPDAVDPGHGRVVSDWFWEKPAAPFLVKQGNPPRTERDIPKDTWPTHFISSGQGDKSELLNDDRAEFVVRRQPTLLGSRLGGDDTRPVRSVTMLERLPQDKRLMDDLRGLWTNEFVQAAGTAEAMMIEVRKPNPDGSGTLYRLARPAPSGQRSTERVDIAWFERVDTIPVEEVFTAEEAGDVFWYYYQHSDVPTEYELRFLETN